MAATFSGNVWANTPVHASVVSITQTSVLPTGSTVTIDPSLNGDFTFSGPDTLDGTNVTCTFRVEWEDNNCSCPDGEMTYRFTPTAEGTQCAECALPSTFNYSVKGVTRVGTNPNAVNGGDTITLTDECMDAYICGITEGVDITDSEAFPCEWSGTRLVGPCNALDSQGNDIAVMLAIGVTLIGSGGTAAGVVSFPSVTAVSDGKIYDVQWPATGIIQADSDCDGTNGQAFANSTYFDASNALPGHDDPGVCPSPSVTINQFDAGDISHTAWNANRSTFPVTSAQLDNPPSPPNTSPIAGSGNPRAPQGGNIGLDGSVGHIGISASGINPPPAMDQFNRGHEIPTMNSSGQFEFYHSTLNHDNHTMVLPIRKDGVDLGGYDANGTDLDTAKAFKTTLRSIISSAVSTFLVNWILHWQSGSHHIALFIKQGAWAVELLQAPKPVLATINVVQGQAYEIEIDVTYGATNGSAKTKIVINGTTLFDSTDANYAGGSTAQTWGNYQSRDNSLGALILGDSYKLEFTDA